MKFTSILVFHFILYIAVINKGFCQNLLINEFVSSNSSGIQDMNGAYSDWLEIYNHSDSTINLLGYFLSDNDNVPNKCTLPNIDVAPYGYRIIFASGENAMLNSEVHVGFKIKQDGEELILSAPNGNLVSRMDPIYLPANKSCARIPDGGTEIQIADIPSPGRENSYVGISDNYYSGLYNQELAVDISCSNPDMEIYYTLDGSVPTIHSERYTEQIILNSDTKDPIISLIPTTPLKGEPQLYNFIWKQPKNVYMGNVLRYAAFNNGIRQTKICSKTFFIGEDIKNRYTFPVVSLITDSLNLFDYETGIYIPGKKFDTEGFNWWPSGNYHNRGRDWERDAHVTFFDKGELIFESDAGMRMRGYGSASNPQKSFTIYFRNSYGTESLKYKLFNDSEAHEFKRLIFRNSGNDFIYSHFKDALLQGILQSMNLDLQGFKPAVVFINGEYWGIHNIREKYDKFYFKNKMKIDEDEVNILGICGQVEEGSNADYKEIVNFIETNDMTLNESYAIVKEYIDLNNFIDFQIAEIYFANYDWPCNNFKIWKDNRANSKWRFLIYDLDLSFGYDGTSDYKTKSMEHATLESGNWPHCSCSNLIFRKLLKNETFKDEFLDRFAYCLEHVFNARRVNQLIDEFELLYKPEISEHIDRWQYPASVSLWEEEVEKLRFFASNRPCSMTENLMWYFDLESYSYDCISDSTKINDDFLVFPNPTSGKFSIYNNTDEIVRHANVKIRDAYGRLYYSENNIDIYPLSRYRVRLENTPSGLYVINLQMENKFVSKQIIIQH